MKIFIALSESPLKAKKIAIYCLLILFLVPELLRILKRIKSGTRDCTVLDKISQT